ncbi:MAG TPA: hypothetical protein VK876_06090 [Rubrivivax sp.]|nr:hypothetical protein [Rubrivivax sp.]
MNRSFAPSAPSAPVAAAAGPNSPGRETGRETPWLRLWRADPRLMAFALVFLAFMLPAAVALGVDERLLRGVNVWVKPLKFMAALALLALTTVWFAQYLPAAVRQGRAYRALVWTLMLTGGFEVGYISLQAALGQASHYNVGDALHGLMYTLMGLAALALTATQAVLAWLLWRHGDRTLAPAYRLAAVLGLALSFVLGAGAGALLGGLQPPTGAGLPVLGWSTTGGDLRVAHFIGLHAGQVLPVIGAVLAAVAASRVAVAGVWLAASAWTLLWAVALARALAGLPLLGL